MIYISTDYVFNGQGSEPWQPDCKGLCAAQCLWADKAEGEPAVSQTLEKYFIVRIAWVFGVNGKNFIKTMLNVGKHTIRFGLSMIRLVHRPTLMIWQDYWWI